MRGKNAAQFPKAAGAVSSDELGNSLLQCCQNRLQAGSLSKGSQNFLVTFSSIIMQLLISMLSQADVLYDFSHPLIASPFSAVE
jgi:hypothetical protein